MEKNHRINMDKGVHIDGTAGKSVASSILPQFTFTQDDSFSVKLTFTPLVDTGVFIPFEFAQSTNHSAFGAMITATTGYYYIHFVDVFTSTSIPVKAGDTKNIFLTYDGGAKTARIYIDGTSTSISLVGKTFTVDQYSLASTLYNAPTTYKTNGIYSELAIFNTAIDKIGGTIKTDYIEAMNRNGNWIPAELHANVVEHLTCQESSGDKLYSCVEDYNYAKSLNLKRNGLVQHEMASDYMSLVLNSEGHMVVPANPESKSYSSMSATTGTIQPGLTYTVKLVGIMPVGSMLYFYCFGRYVFTLDWGNTPTTDNNTVYTYTFTAANTVSVPTVENRPYMFYAAPSYQGTIKSFEITASGAEPNIALTNNHADLVGYTSGELLAEGGARKDIVTKATYTNTTGFPEITGALFVDGTHTVPYPSGTVVLSYAGHNVLAYKLKSGMSLTPREELEIKANSQFANIPRALAKMESYWLHNEFYETNKIKDWVGTNHLTVSGYTADELNPAHADYAIVELNTLR